MAKIWEFLLTAHLDSGQPWVVTTTKTAQSNWESTAVPAQRESGGISTGQPSRQAGNEGFEEFVFQPSPLGIEDKGKHKYWDLDSRARQTLAQWNNEGRAG